MLVSGTGDLQETALPTRSHKRARLFPSWNERKEHCVFEVLRGSRSLWSEAADTPFVYFAPFPARLNIMAHFPRDDSQNHNLLLCFLLPCIGRLEHGPLSSVLTLYRFGDMTAWSPYREPYSSSIIKKCLRTELPMLPGDGILP